MPKKKQKQVVSDPVLDYAEKLRKYLAEGWLHREPGGIGGTGIEFTALSKELFRGLLEGLDEIGLEEITPSEATALSKKFFRDMLENLEKMTPAEQEVFFKTVTREKVQ